MRKYFILILFALCALTSVAQPKTDVRATRVIADQVLLPPLIDTILTPSRLGHLVVRPQDTLVYIGIKITSGGKRWDLLSNWIGAVPGTGGVWGALSGLLSDQSDLMDALNARLLATQSVPFDTTGAQTGDALVLDRTGGDTIKMAPFPTSGGSGAFSVLDWFTGDTNAPEVLDSILANTDFSGKYLNVYRNGVLQRHILGDTGFYRLNDTTIKVTPAFADNEHWHIEARDSSSYTEIVLQAPPSAPASWHDATFLNQTGHLTNTSGVWSVVAGAWTGQAVETGSGYTGEVGVKIVRQNGTDAFLTAIGLKSTNTLAGYTTYDFGFYFDNNNPSVLYSITGGTVTSTGYTLTTGTYIRIYRNTSNVITLQSSPDGTTWTTRHTFSGTHPGTLYAAMNMYATSFKAYYPQILY